MDEAEFVVLKARAEANRWFGIALACTLIKVNKDFLPALNEVVAATAAHLLATGKKNEAGFLSHELPIINALVQDGNLDPVKALAIKSLLHLEAPSDQQEALNSWLQSASEDELSDEIRGLLERLSEGAQTPDGSLSSDDEET